jgi:RNA polymerase sigma-70 factor, ECF subfamily
LKRAAVRWISSHGLGEAEAEDVFQQGLLKALKTPAGPEEGKVTSWFYQILRNTLTDEFRNAKRTERRNEEYAAEVKPFLDPATEESLCRCVLGLLDDLAPTEKKILEGHFFDGKKFKDLSAEFNQSEGAIRIKAQRARERLKESLRRCCKMTSFGEASGCEC